MCSVSTHSAPRAWPPVKYVTAAPGFAVKQARPAAPRVRRAGCATACRSLPSQRFASSAAWQDRMKRMLHGRTECNSYGAVGPGRPQYVARRRRPQSVAWRRRAGAGLAESCGRGGGMPARPGTARLSPARPSRWIGRVAPSRRAARLATWQPGPYYPSRDMTGPWAPRAGLGCEPASTRRRAQRSKLQLVMLQHAAVGYDAACCSW